MGLNILICVDDVANEKLTHQVSSLEVYEKIDENTHYKLTFMVDVCDEDIAKSLDENTAPGKILSVLTKVDDTMISLVKGPVTRQETHLQHGGAGSWIKVEGEDSGYNMDRAVNFQVHASGTDSDIAMTIISNSDNMEADVEDTPDSSHSEDTHTLVQRQSNLALVRSLARRNGMHFWITWTDQGQATGHFRSRSLDGSTTADLLVNVENYNIDSLRVHADPRRPSQTVGKQLDLSSKETFGDTFTLDDPMLGKDGLAAVTGTGDNTQSMHLAPVVDDIGAMQARSKGALRDAQWFIHATCRTSLHRLCKIIRFHTLVNVQGAGSRHSGKYYVTAVKHIVDAAAHVMELELARNAWGNEAGGPTGIPNSIF